MTSKRMRTARRTNTKKVPKGKRLAKAKNRRSGKRLALGRPLKNPLKTGSIHPIGDVWVSLSGPTSQSSWHRPRDMHVLVSATGHRWIVRKSGAARGIGTFDTREEAIAHARNLAKDSNSQLYIHRKDGRVSDVRSYVKEGKGAYK